MAATFQNIVPKNILLATARAGLFRHTVPAEITADEPRQQRTDTALPVFNNIFPDTALTIAAVHTVVLWLRKFQIKTAPLPKNFLSAYPILTASRFLRFTILSAWKATAELQIFLSEIRETFRGQPLSGEPHRIIWVITKKYCTTGLCAFINRISSTPRTSALSGATMSFSFSMILP
jgi:hypothetical protein